jgi:cellulose synthase/poly-beta-1,6-N-acetylglucosamine synthase-like glycosyltransferase
VGYKDLLLAPACALNERMARVAVLFFTVNAFLAIPVVVFLIEVTASVVFRSTYQRNSGSLSRRLAVLVPAHNEEAGLSSTLGSIKLDLMPGDRLLVVADNCTDNTASVARSARAEVIERYDLSHIGKGFALDYGLRHLDDNPPDIVIMIDADCKVTPGTLDALSSTCTITNRPAQAQYMMTAPPTSDVKRKVAEFAWCVKNKVRPLGLLVMGLPCQLTGSGMAFPWAVIQSANLASGAIVEDLKLGLDLAMAGHPPVFCPSAQVNSEFASSAKGAEDQRRRWEHGHINMIISAVLPLVIAGIKRGDAGLIALGFDLAIPPVALLAILLIFAIFISATLVFAGGSTLPLILGLANLSAFAFAVFVAWWHFGREIIPFRSILSIPAYVLSKAPLYQQLLLSRNRVQRWIRTDRGQETEKHKQ